LDSTSTIFQAEMYARICVIEGGDENKHIRQSSGSNDTDRTHLQVQKLVTEFPDALKRLVAKCTVTLDDDQLANEDSETFYIGPDLFFGVWIQQYKVQINAGRVDSKEIQGTL
jgi:hypothetical protein